MSTHAKWFLILGGFTAALSVAFGAAGWHVLKSSLAVNDTLGLFPMALQYHQLHALALLILGLLVARFPTIPCFVWAGWLIFVGILLFSGTLYLRSITGTHGFPVVTSVGGSLFIIGWLLCTMGAIRLQRNPS